MKLETIKSKKVEKAAEHTTIGNSLCGIPHMICADEGVEPETTEKTDEVVKRLQDESRLLYRNRAGQITTLDI